MSLHESFLQYREFFYLKIAAGLSVAAVVAYICHDPVEAPNGGTWLGYTLGVLGVAMVAWLAWFGVRKRQYSSSLGSVQGWLSAHVYLGLAVLVVATLHTGFQTGWNVHTLAYALLVIVVASGIVGVVLYRLCPRLITDTMGDATRRDLLSAIGETNHAMLRLADRIGGDVHDIILANIDRTRLGGSVFERFVRFQPRSAGGIKSGAGVPTVSREDANRYLYDAMTVSTDAQRTQDLRALASLIGHKDQLVTRLNRELWLRALLEAWLFVHVPATVALLVALPAHVLAVFLYW